ncbi:hypothetical protein F4819DRAFT_491080 [Hypoxylon fuscum]|nr:hypothetical protein F4819DRAFT_491080 [Hypoxylon fuscum]
MDHGNRSREDPERNILCWCTHARNCHSANNYGHEFTPTYLVDRGMRMAYDLGSGQVLTFRNGRIGGPVDNHGHGQGSNQGVTESPMGGQAQNPNHGNFHGGNFSQGHSRHQNRHHHPQSNAPGHGHTHTHSQTPHTHQQPSRQPTAHGLRIRGDDPHAETLYPFCEDHMREHFGDDFTQREPTQYNAAVAAVQRQLQWQDARANPPHGPPPDYDSDGTQAPGYGW